LEPGACGTGGAETTRSAACEPGKRTYIHGNFLFARLPKAPLPSSAGPFASAKFPENLEELRAQTLKAIGRPASAAKITLPHPDVAAQDEKERAKAAEIRWHTANVIYNGSFEKRRLHILNALFLALNRQGHNASFNRQDHHTELWVIIGDTCIAVTLDETGRKPDVHDRHTALRPDAVVSPQHRTRAGARAGEAPRDPGH
jgi:hypothetical protein